MTESFISQFSVVYLVSTNNNLLGTLDLCAYRPVRAATYVIDRILLLQPINFTTYIFYTHNSTSRVVDSMMCEISGVCMPC